MSRSIFRVSIPVNDEWHLVKLSGPILHVAARRPDEVEIWLLNDPTQAWTVHNLRVFGTGYPLPDDAAGYVGTAIAPGGQLVWHLMERTRGSAS